MSTQTATLIAFHGKQSVKDYYLARARGHRAQDEIRQGFGYWVKSADGIMRGCAVGCTLHSDNHEAYETELGIPSALAYLEDGLFERMTAERSKSWPVDFLEAIPVGADLSKVSAQMILWFLIDEADGITANDISDDVRAMTLELAGMFQSQLDGAEPTPEAWAKFYDEAWTKFSALRDLSDLSALSALRDLSDLSDLSALSALRALRDLSDLSALSALPAARQFAVRCADKLLQFLSSAPVVSVVSETAEVSA